MSEPLEKRLISAFAAAWGEAAQGVLGKPSELSLLALREVAGEQMKGALALATTWSAAFAAPCEGSLPGVVLVLLKSEEAEEVERLAKQPADGQLKPGGRALVTAALSSAAAAVSAEASVPVSFGGVAFMDLAAEPSRLAAVVGQAAHVGTFALTLGDDPTQAVLLYAPQGSMQAAQVHASKPAAAQVATAPVQAAAAAAVAPAPVRRGAQRPDQPKNIERLLGVELNLVVRFGATSLPLRDVVRMGVGTIIELNRSVEEPVELLVNGRLLGRGEVVVVDGHYGVRITEIGAPSERPLTLV